jgi:glutamate synthase (NADPH/NADH) small chain
MNPNGSTHERLYVWREIDRADPPKRAASERIGDFHEIYSLLDEATVREQASRCIQCPQPSCREGCPLSNRIPEWLALTAEGKFLEAAEVSQSTSNMPEICSRVCPQEKLCEGSCILVGHAEPICIGAIEKFINEYSFAHYCDTTAVGPSNGFRVAVVGSGPGSLACADELAKIGCNVTMFEAQSQAGGLLLNGIPGFKLDKFVVERRINILRCRGVKIETGTLVGVDLQLSKLRKDFHAVFLGIGAQKAKPLDIPGSDMRGVHPALPFLIQRNSTMPLDIPRIEVKGKRVAVLGGGDTAMDCLRSAIRGGASEAVCVYRRDLANMPGSRKEYYNAIEEGAHFLFLTNPVALDADASGNVTSVRCTRMELGEPDFSGRRKPRIIPGSEFNIQADVLLIAYGFDPVPFPKDSDFAAIAINDWGAIRVDENQMTNMPGVFAGGDIVRGASLVVHAVRDGRKAALGIQRYLQTIPKESAG